jgi:polyribonucleotide 5'-hydroxyl-kinase
MDNSSSQNKDNKSKEEVTNVTIDKEHEFRFQVEFDSSVTIKVQTTILFLTSKLLTGTAECFGTELAPERPYIFTGVKSAIFTWHGCTLEVNSKISSIV